MIEERAVPFFFTHVMKTGGTSLVWQLLTIFEPDEMYPSEVDRSSPNDTTLYYVIPKLLDLSPERRARIRVYAGHFPYVASELLGIDLIRLTMVRDPVDRAVSMLKHVKRLFDDYHDLSLEAIYEDDAIFRSFLDSFQTNVFALTAEERKHALAFLESDANTDAQPAARSVPLEPHRFEHAKANLANVDVIGLSEEYGAFVAELHDRFGLWPNGVKQQVRTNVSAEDWPVSAALRRRIAEELTTDIEFYEYAKELVAARRRAS